MMVKPPQSEGPGTLGAVAPWGGGGYASAEKSTMEKSLHNFEELKEKIAHQLKE
jgi:hypothetical protein